MGSAGEASHISCKKVEEAAALVMALVVLTAAVAVGVVMGVAMAVNVRMIV